MSYHSLSKKTFKGLIKIKIVKINVDDNKEIAVKFGIQSIPTMLIFIKGELKEQIVGSLPKNQIEKTLMDLI